MLSTIRLGGGVAKLFSLWPGSSWRQLRRRRRQQPDCAVRRASVGGGLWWHLGWARRGDNRDSGGGSGLTVPCAARLWAAGSGGISGRARRWGSSSSGSGSGGGSGLTVPCRRRQRRLRRR
jgi:hypothetical protein